jgi:hypothetical protein
MWSSSILREFFKSIFGYAVVYVISRRVYSGLRGGRAGRRGPGQWGRRQL